MRTAESWPDNPTRRGGQGPHEWRVSGSRDLARGVRRASRHSRAVRFLRLAIPFGAVLAVAAVTLASWLSPLRMLASLPTISGRVAVSGSKVLMEAPRLSKFTPDGRGYAVTAETAVQDLTKPDILELTDIRGKLNQQDKSTIDLTAVSGLYDRKTEMLILQQHIVLTSSTGFVIHLTEAAVDVPKHYVVSNKPVQVELTDGVINGNRLEVIDDGDLIVFDGGVQMMVKPQPATATDKAPQ